MFFPAFTLKDLIDILLIATILYGVFRLLRHSGAVNLFWGILLFILTWFIVSYVFQLELTGALFDRIISVGAIALIVIFQNEIRSFFNHLGLRMGKMSRIFRSSASVESQQVLQQVVIACSHMAKQRTGALIVLTNKQDLLEYAETGEFIDADVSTRLIENIFFKNSPLHDGALIIHKDRLYSAACVLPISANRNLPKHYGLRHRAGLGISEKTDAVAVVVSEETGHISVAHEEKMTEVEVDELLDVLLVALDSKKQINNI